MKRTTIFVASPPALVRILFLVFTFLIAALFFANAQSRIHGIIVDTAGKPVLNANVLLLRAKDSLLMKGLLTDKDGAYGFENIKPGKYLINATHSGIKPVYSPTFDVGDKQADIDIGVIQLKETNIILSNVTVTASRPFIEMHLDKMVINVEASPTNAGANALEVLAKSPGINVDMDENINLNGKQGVLVLIDGKKTWLSGKELATLLKSMPASNIDQIEIMNNPSAKYEAEGMAGVINIRTKKNKNDGWNGNLSTGGRTGILTYNGSTYLLFNPQNNLNFNYKKNKVNLFSSLSFSHWTSRGVGIYNKTYYTSLYDVNGYTFFITNRKFSFNYLPLSVGLDYTINKKNLVGIVMNGVTGVGDHSEDRTTDLWNERHQLSGHYESNSKSKYKFWRTAFNINWKHSFDTLGQEITFDADYVYFRNPTKDNLNTDYFNNQAISETSLLHSDNQSSSNIFAFKSDYTKPFKGGRLESGIKLSAIYTTFSSLFFRYLNNTWEPDFTLTNQASYNENINAVYLNLNKQIKKWSFQGGLRLENMNMNAEQSLGSYKINRTNTGLFPSFFASYSLNKNNTVKISMSRRINRYSFYSIMPYVQVVDSLDIWHGNPNLKPEHNNKMELACAYKNKYFITFSYTITHDAIRYIAAQVSTQKITEFYPANIDKLDNLNLDLTIPVKLTKWWDVNLFTNAYTNKYYNLQNGSISKFYLTLNENISNTFNLGKGFKGELILNYSTKSVDQLGETFARLNDFSIGLQKQIIKEKGSLALNITDPFQWCYRYKFNGTFLRMYEWDNNYFNSRTIGVTFNYRFGKVNNQGRQHTTASQEEQSR